MKRFIRELSTRRPASAHVNRAPLAPSPSDLLRRLTEFHLSDDGRKNKSEAEERSRSVLRWMRESDKCKDEQSLERMVDQYVVKQLPLAYILGNQPFGNVNLVVEPPVLIPRPETEEWTMRLLKLMKKTKGDLQVPARVLDLCSGSGCISLAIAKGAPDFLVTGLDISEKAIELSRKNALKNKLQNVIYKKVDIFNDEELQNAKLAKYDLIVSNPPYIPPNQHEKLDRSVKDFEDVRALVGRYQANAKDASYSSPPGSGEAGLDFYHRIRNLAEKLSAPYDKRAFSRAIPWLVLEFGQGQADQVKEIFQGYRCKIQKDFNDIERTIEVYEEKKR